MTWNSKKNPLDIFHNSRKECKDYIKVECVILAGIIDPKSKFTVDS